MPAVASSNIAAIEHDAETEMMTVQFVNGAVYQYSGVPREIYEAFLGSSSKGKFLHSVIKNSYAAERIS